MSTSLTVVVEKPRGRKKQPEGQSLYVLPHVVHGLDALAAQLDLAPFSSFVREDPELFAEMAEELDEETRARFASQIQAQKDWHCWRTCGRPMPRNSPPTSMRQNRSSPSGPFSRMRVRLLSRPYVKSYRTVQSS